MVVQTCNFGTWEVVAGQSYLRLAWLHIETLPPKANELVNILFLVSK